MLDSAHQKERLQEVPFDDVEVFLRQIMTQNIFIHTVGVNGKHESTILAKAVFSMNKVVRLYYSTSFDETQSGFIRIRPDVEQQLIVVERLHGYRSTPEILYASHEQAHVIRYVVRWLLRRIDWSKTKLTNLDLYKRYIEQEQEEYLAKIAQEELARQEAEVAQVIKKHAKQLPKRIVAPHL
ncbi:hypothetical protein [Thiomicrorhabdus aquaedulcis]|uniref:hypothetical protein n=1 Tax=Thiomicrorhabdus aquaedulcis TaxID=2211106 RepID=UPI00187FF8E3|nr:hypothetical protein [Thiomicrorhabdus aquaedulcis]